MTVADLIKTLQGLNQDATVVFEIDGDSNRTGDFLDASEVDQLELRRTTYGGSNPADDKDPSQKNPEFYQQETFTAVVIH